MQTFQYASLVILTAIILFLDIVTYTGVKKMGWIQSYWIKKIFPFVFWGFTAFFLVDSYKLTYDFQNKYSTELHVKTFYQFALGLLVYLPKIIFVVFYIIEELVRLFTRLYRRFFFKPPQGFSGAPMTRSRFLSKTGLAVAAIPFIGISYGVLKGRFDFRSITQVVRIPGLPDAFDGYRIAQISDIHIGSFDKHYDEVSYGIDMVNDQDADLLLFTGDLVNVHAHEMEGWLPVLERMQARDGMYSVLGNHDYSDYGNFQSESARNENSNNIKALNRAIGFDLLLNENRLLEKDGQSLALVGVENWGAGRFSKYGDLKKALVGVEDHPCKILMSHDPTHWDAQVLDTDVRLTLSGHTHGTQFGVELGDLKWSPGQYLYSRWAGLYKEGQQQLYVNRGFGFIGFPGRIGMAPEITVLELRKGKG